jgi:hypothetical protein
MTQIIDQIEKSKFSKHGLTSITGIFEGTPENVVTVLRGYSVPLADSVLPVSQVPIDVVYSAKPQPTYLDYLKTANKV